jgi:hypothetical protein
MTGHAAPITVVIKDQSGAGKVAASITLEGIDSRITLRDLIRTRVREEVARYNAALADVFQGLVKPHGAQPTPEGFRMPKRRRVDWEQQADRALDAFGRNGFFILADGRQITDLGEVLELSAESDIRFLRLVQLVGG